MNASQTSPSGRRPVRWLEPALIIITLLACGVILAQNNADPDLWGHVQYGRDALARGLEYTATYTYTAAGYPWVNHEILAELSFAFITDTFGPHALLSIKCALGVLLIGLMMRKADRQQVGRLTICIVTLLVAVNLSCRWSVRPQLLSFLFYGGLIVLLSWCFQGWEGRWRLRKWEAEGPKGCDYSSVRLRWLWLAVPILWVWANAHGSFVAGYLILCAYLFCRGLEALVGRGRAGWPLVGRLAMIGVACGLVTLLNPYGPEMHRWLLYDLGQPRPEITEWHPPKLTDPTCLPIWAILATWLGCLALSKHPRDFTQVVVMSIAAWQTIEHLRHIEYFAIPFGFWMPRHVDSLMSRWRRGPATDVPVVAAWQRWALGLGTASTVVVLVVTLGERLEGMPVQRNRYPVSAVQYIADQGLNGRMIVSFNWSQYVLASLATPGPNGEPPQVQLDFDGRFRTCYSQEMVDMHCDFELGEFGPTGRYRSKKSPPFSPERVLKYKDPELVLISRGQPHAVEVMERQGEDWTLLYQDEIAQLWGRTSKFAEPSSPHYLPEHQRVVGNAKQLGSVAWPALPERRMHPVRALAEDRPKADSDEHTPVKTSA